MGLTFFRSVKFGPLRFNFSTSGIGVSAGIPGMRIGTGPRGAYINAGSHGFRYRASLGSRTKPASRPSAPTPVPASAVRHDDVVDTTVYETRDVLRLADATASDLLQVLNSQAKHHARWPWMLICGVLGIGLGYAPLAAAAPSSSAYLLA